MDDCSLEAVVTGELKDAKYRREQFMFKVLFTEKIRVLVEE